MKPFDLQKAIEGHPLVTRDGRKVTEFKYFETVTNKYPCVAVADGSILSYTKEGLYYTKEGIFVDIYTIRKSDLFLATQTKWVNLYWDRIGNRVVSLGGEFDSEQEARAAVSNSRDFIYINKTIEIEIP